MKAILTIIAIATITATITATAGDLSGLIKAGEELADATTRPGGDTPVLPANVKNCLGIGIKVAKGEKTGDDYNAVAIILEGTADLAEKQHNEHAVRDGREDAKTLRVFAKLLREAASSRTVPATPPSSSSPKPRRLR